MLDDMRAVVQLQSTFLIEGGGLGGSMDHVTVEWNGQRLSTCTMPTPNVLIACTVPEAPVAPSPQTLVLTVNTVPSTPPSNTMYLYAVYCKNLWVPVLTHKRNVYFNEITGISGI